MENDHMNIELEQLEIVKMLLTVRNKVTLDKVKEIIISSHENDRISIKQYNDELDNAEKRIAEGRFFTQEQIEDEAKEW